MTLANWTTTVFVVVGFVGCAGPSVDGCPFTPGAFVPVGVGGRAGVGVGVGVGTVATGGAGAGVNTGTSALGGVNGSGPAGGSAGPALDGAEGNSERACIKLLWMALRILA